MADVAAAMGMSPGSLYNYVESKEALFHWILERDRDDGPVAAPAALPIPAPAPTASSKRTARAAPRRLPPAALRSGAGAATERYRTRGAELEAVVRELFERIERNRRTMVVIERSAIDLPALFQIYFVTLRRDFFARFARYVERRQATRRFSRRRRSRRGAARCVARP